MKNKENNRILSTLGVVGKQISLIVIALILATIFLAVSGYEPLAIVNGIFDGLTMDIAGTIRWATPLILAGLAICVTYKAEVFNLGVDGQLYMGAAAATGAQADRLRYAEGSRKYSGINESFGGAGAYLPLCHAGRSAVCNDTGSDEGVPGHKRGCIDTAFKLYCSIICGISGNGPAA